MRKLSVAFPRMGGSEARWEWIEEKKRAGKSRRYQK